VLSGDTEPYGVYVGVPAAKVKERAIRAAPR
jgi:acetyltransferase-like isoleucine patch superfamily enzyme